MFTSYKRFVCKLRVQSACNFILRGAPIWSNGTGSTQVFEQAMCKKCLRWHCFFLPSGFILTRQLPIMFEWIDIYIVRMYEWVLGISNVTVPRRLLSWWSLYFTIGFTRLGDSTGIFTQTMPFLGLLCGFSSHPFSVSPSSTAPAQGLASQNNDEDDDLADELLVGFEEGASWHAFGDVPFTTPNPSSFVTCKYTSVC